MEMKKNFDTSNICQVDIADNYDHKHQNLSPEDAEKGLSRIRQATGHTPRQYRRR